MANDLHEIAGEFDPIENGQLNDTVILNHKFNILKQKINEEFLIHLATDKCKIDQIKDKRNCKILKFSSDINFDKVLLILSKLKSQEYSSLFIFIITIDNYEFLDPKSERHSEKLELAKKFLLNFSENRPILVQIVSKNYEMAQFYYKDDHLIEFLSIDQQNSDFDSHQDFPSFFMSVITEKINHLEDLMIDELLGSKNSCLILKYIRIFQLNEFFLIDLILSIAEIGTKEQLLAALDAPFGENGRMLSVEAQDHLSFSYTYGNGNTQSVLLLAVQNFNNGIVGFLIENFTHLIQQLPYDHKIEISTAAFISNQFEILCDLLQYSDFPFPSNFDSNSIKNERLLQIMDKRKTFHDAISKQDFEAVQKFIEDSSDLKFIFDVENKSALGQAFTSKAFNVYFHLKSLGFQSTEVIDHEVMLKDEELKQARNAATVQLYENIRTSISNEERSVLILSARSTIHNKKLTREVETKYRGKIQQWFNEINMTKFGSDLLNVAAQCEQLKMIFDFECKTVSNIRLKGNNSLGTTYPVQKWIFIGAKMSNESREQEIKGTIAHELFHYVMRLVFENSEKPYHKNDVNALESFDQIIKEIDLWTIQESNVENQEPIDDGCDGIISTVFTLYNKEDHHPELIVRVAQILVQFDNDTEKLKQLIETYKPLFEFHEFHVIPEMRKLNSKNRKFNQIVGLSPEIQTSGLEISTPKDLSSISNTKAIIAVSNIPKLLLVDIFKQSCAAAHSPFIDDKNIFITSGILNNSAIVNEYKHIQRENKDMNVYVDCTEEIECNFGSLFINQTQKITFVVQNEIQSQKLTKLLEQIKCETREAFVNFEWMDLTLDSRKSLISILLNFQNGKVTFYDLMTRENLEGDSKQQQEEKIATELLNVIDDQLLNLLVNKSKISINIYFNNALTMDINFNILFQVRRFIKIIGTNAGKTSLIISIEEFLMATKNQKFVLISDIAGTGKSWALRSITKKLQEMFGTCWVTYVDLKKFINAFKTLKNDATFLTFMVENVFREFKKFESKIFMKLYEIGKTFVLFDGFDEISPDYCVIVIKLIKTFQHNGGNQLWVATRDYFEVDLQKHLELDVAYKLDEFTQQNGIDLISSIWILNGIESGSKTNIKPDDIKMSPNFKSNQDIARKLIKKISNLQFSSIGFPQFYKMAAEVFKDDKFVGQDLNVFEIYKEFSKIQIERWSHEKGELRKETSKKAQQDILNFTEIHQFFAMKSLFPDEEEYCDLEYDEDDWPDSEIIGCGLMTKTGEYFSFLHETFREFFSADFILSNLKKGAKSNFFYFFIKILTVLKYEVIRMFINDALADGNVYNKITSKMQKFKREFNKNTNGNEDFSMVFIENIQNLTNLFIALLKNCDYEKVHEILNNSVQKVIRAAPKNFVKFQDFFIEFLKVDDLKEFASKHDILREMTKSSLEADVIMEFAAKIDEKANFAKKLLSEKDFGGRNFFLFLCSDDVLNVEKFKILFEEFSHKYFTSSEHLDLQLEQCDTDGMKMMHHCVDSEKEEKLEFVWNKFENFFKSQNVPQNFKDLLKQKNLTYEFNFLHYATFCKETKFHETLWRLLLKTFENRDELKDLILQQDKDGDNFVHLLMAECFYPDIIEFTFKIMKENFTDAQYQEIFMSKGHWGRNLLQVAARWSKDVKVVKVLWKIIKNSCRNFEKFVEFVKEIDDSKYNIFHLSVRCLTCEMFEFLIHETEIFLSHEEHRQMLSAVNFENRNILQFAADYNKYEKFHQKLWKVLIKYFEPLEILKFLCHKDEDGLNVLEIATEKNTHEIVELSWNEIKNLLNANDLIGIEMEEAVSLCSKFMRDSGKPNDFDESLKIKFRNKWNEIVEFLEVNFKNDSTNSEFFQTKNEGPKSFIDLTSCHDINIFKSIWESSIKEFENNGQLKMFITKNDFLHKIVFNCEPDIIKFTFEIVREIFEDSQFQEILELKCIRGRNLLQTSLLNRKNFGAFLEFWNVIKTHFNTDENLMKIFTKVDENKQIVIQLAAGYSSTEIFEFLIQELEKIGTKQQIKLILSNLDIDDRNLLQIAVEKNYSLKLHVYLWKVIHKYFEPSETPEFLTNPDKYGRNLLLFAIRYSTQSILELTWNEMTKIVTDDELKGIVERRVKESNNILHLCADSKEKEKLEFIWKNLKKFPESLKELCKQKNLYFEYNFLHSATYCKEIKLHETLWSLLLETLNDREELKELILQEDKFGMNCIQLLVKLNTSEIIKFTLNTLKKNFSSSHYQEILMSKNFKGMNLLQIATVSSDDIDIHKILFEIFRNSYDSEDCFKQFLKDVCDDKCNIFHHTAQHSTSEIFKFFIQEIEKIASREEIKKLLNALNYEDGSLLHSAAYGNKSSDLHESLWKCLQKYFEHSEISELINHGNIFGETVLLIASQHNTKEIVDLTWSKIQNYIHQNDYVHYLNRKDEKGNGLLKFSHNNSGDLEVHQWVVELMKNYSENLD